MTFAVLYILSQMFFHWQKVTQQSRVSLSVVTALYHFPVKACAHAHKAHVHRAKQICPVQTTRPINRWSCWSLGFQNEKLGKYEDKEF